MTTPSTPAPAAGAPTAPRDPAVASYARFLLGQVQRLLQVVPEAERGPALAALDRFLAAPRADTFVAASRALRVARVARATDRLRASHDHHAFQRGLDAVRAAPGLDPAHARMLAMLPMDARTGQRLLALAQLLEVHHELSGLTAAASRELRRKLAARATTPPRAGSPTRPPGSRRGG